MRRLLRADFLRLRKSNPFRLCLIGMLVLATGFMVMQATGMDFTVPLSRVIFLPMSMYGIAMAAFVSVFVGTDFSDGVIRNKLLAANHRRSLVLSHILVSCAACVIVYAAVTAFTAGIGRFFFENNVEASEFIRLFLLGIGMSLSSKIGIGGASTKGHSQTELSRMTAPPPKQKYGIWVGLGFAVIVVLALMGDAVSTICGAGFAAFFIAKSFRYNQNVHPQLMRQWENSWVCFRCGHKFGFLAVSSG